MSDVKVFMIVNLQIHDADMYRNYEKGFFPILKKHGGEFITYDDNIVNVEGDNDVTGRIIIFSFPMKKLLIIGTTIQNTKRFQNSEETPLQLN